MGRLLLVARLVVRDLRHRPAQAILLLLAITAATATLTLGLALNGVTNEPYQQTRAATAGPDVVAQGPAASLAAMAALTRAPAVTGHSGPYPYTYVTLQANGRKAGARAEGRDLAPAAVDQPALTQGDWVRPGEVVLERSFADELGVRAGDVVTLDGQPFRIAGIAVTAASTLLYPHICYSLCDLSTAQLAAKVPGLVWLTQADARRLATSSEPLSYTLNLKLEDPAQASRFASAYDNSHASSSALFLNSWQNISRNAATLVRIEQQILQTGGWLLGLLAVASVAILVGGRMAEQTRRVGLLKASGGTPELITSVLLAEHAVVALAAAAIGLAAGRLTVPLLTGPGTGLLGTVGSPNVGPSTIGVVVAVALGVGVVAAFVPAIRAARTSTVSALTGEVRPPRRSTWLIGLSARLPVPLLIGLRLAARRPRRTLLTVASIAVTASGIVAVLCTHAGFVQAPFTSSGLTDPTTGQLSQVMTVLTVALVVLAATNAVLITWATVLDSRRISALARALGATPEQVSEGLATAQTLPAVAGALLGIPGGIELFASVNKDGAMITPPAWWLAASTIGTIAAVAAITTIPAWLGSRHPAAQILRGEAG